MVSSWLKVLHYGRGKLGPKEQPSFDEDTVCCVVHGYETVPFPRQTVSDLHALLEINKKVKQKFRNKTITISTPFHKYQPVQVLHREARKAAHAVALGIGYLLTYHEVQHCCSPRQLCLSCDSGTHCALTPSSHWRMTLAFREICKKICSSCELQSFAFCFDYSSFY